MCPMRDNVFESYLSVDVFWKGEEVSKTLPYIWKNRRGMKKICFTGLQGQNSLLGICVPPVWSSMPERSNSASTFRCFHWSHSWRTIICCTDRRIDFEFAPRWLLDSFSLYMLLDLYAFPPWPNNCHKRIFRTRVGGGGEGERNLRLGYSSHVWLKNLAHAFVIPGCCAPNTPFFDNLVSRHWIQLDTLNYSSKRTDVLSGTNPILKRKKDIEEGPRKVDRLK